jgi:hypothetical protein
VPFFNGLAPILKADRKQKGRPKGGRLYSNEIDMA